MPLYEYRCTADHNHPLTTAYRPIGRRRDPLACDTCGAETEKAISVPMGFQGFENPIPVKQLGRTFANAKELDAYCEANNLEVRSSSSPAARAFVDAAIEDAQEQCREEGYRDWDHWDESRNNADHVRDLSASVRERVAQQQGGDSHHADSPTFKKPLPAGKLKVATATTTETP